MTYILDPTLQMWVVIAVLAAAMISFALERVSLELTSLATLSFLLLWFQIFPLADARGDNVLSAAELLRGFANPSLFAVLALLVMGQAMVQTGALTGLTRMFVRLAKNHRQLAVASGFTGVMLTSAFLNNTPVVVMFIPIMQALAIRLNTSPSSLMMPLSFAAILGGMTTLIGSSTNLLVSSALTDIGESPLAMFDFLVIPDEIKHWSMTTMRGKPIKIGARVVRVIGSRFRSKHSCATVFGGWAESSGKSRMKVIQAMSVDSTGAMLPPITQ